MDKNSWLLLRSLVGIVVVTLIIPIAIRRLRSMRVNYYISLLLFLPPVFGFRNISALGINLPAKSTYVIAGLCVTGYIVYLGLVFLPPRKKSK